ncbi:hypothetical protein [Hymenobacter sp. BT730]|uniref:hypothetical protein n=1 Tax=Hymenobacter sp. BT730 TaxID=3063332 RepID=UPI0026DF5917|nr:hypothetical protein [Hymenobacter sp. BT730]
MSDSKQPKSSKEYSPKDFLRGRRPEQFSDSVPTERQQLDRSLLEYHLDTLTNRGQENDFETFCRRLAEREICPNLMPHTGPTGGGDSKVDSETYPVADALAEAWYSGIGREAASERWAFAISAKKDWRPKVQSDVAKIITTDRGYTTVFFFSSRYIRDKERAEVEDALAKKHQVKVHIFDRTWLLDKVFENRHETLAIETLRMAVPVHQQVQPGPQDAQRLVELEEMQTRIREAISQQQYSSALVDECLEAAILARQLERATDETDGLFARASRLAAKYGTEQQVITCLYQRAWTAYWWHEDLLLFEELYSKLEKAVAGTRNVFDLERLQNLWSIYQTAVRHKDINAEPGEVARRTELLVTELTRLSHEVSRPSTSLQARSHLLLIELLQHISDADWPGLDAVLVKMRAVVRQSAGLVGFVLDPLVDVITTLGKLVVDLPAYDSLFDELVEISSIRKSEVAGATMLVERGVQQCDGGKPAEAIKNFGKALGKLYKHESRREAVKALAVCGVAYDKLNLHWAARNSMLVSASIATDEHWRYGEITPAQYASYKRLSWLELQLGRVAFALSWFESYLVVGNILRDKNYVLENFEEEQQEFDLVLGLLLLKTAAHDLPLLHQLPDKLDTLGLFNSSLAVLYVLGYEDEILKEGPFSEQPENIAVFFEKWLDQPANTDLPTFPSYYEGEIVHLSSTVMGCRLEVTAVNDLAAILLAESLLAGFESFLATSISTAIVLMEPVLTIDVQRDSLVTEPFVIEHEEREGRPHIRIRCGQLNTHFATPQAQTEFKEALTQLLFTMLASVVMRSGIEEQMAVLFRDELAMSRAIDFSNSFIATTNVLGDEPKYRISHWAVSTGREYPAKRTRAWFESRPTATATPKPAAPIKDAKPDAAVAHDEIEISSLLRHALWDRAGWVGVGFGGSPSLPYPVLCLLFSDKDAGLKIFELWRKEMGWEDTEDKLRISLIRRYDRNNPLAYRAIVGTNIDALSPKQREKRLITTHRVHVMDKPTTNNIDPFMAHFQQAGAYVLIPGVFTSPTTEPLYFQELGILKRKVFVREAWQVGLNDPDCAGIALHDEPVIPEGVTEPPILTLQAMMRSGRWGS